tara:strand:+ start:35 stop:574 length:540 start_codon:yes stop_codon:yes gene_type:complete
MRLIGLRSEKLRELTPKIAMWIKLRPLLSIGLVNMFATISKIAPSEGGHYNMNQFTDGEWHREAMTHTGLFGQKVVDTPAEVVGTWSDQIPELLSKRIPEVFDGIKEFLSNASGELLAELAFGGQIEFNIFRFVVDYMTIEKYLELVNSSPDKIPFEDLPATHVFSDFRYIPYPKSSTL